MSKLRRIVKTALLVTPVLITVYDQVGYVGIIRGNSMRPTLNPASSKWTDLVLVDRLSVKWTPVSRGEVVVLIYPKDPRISYVKRVVAVEGDFIRPRNRRSHHVVPAGHCWVEGDNGRASNDSNNFGVVSRGLIQARVRCVIWPLSRLRHLQKGLLADQQERLTIIDECNVT